MASDSIKRIQQALKDKGFDPGPVDGVWGRANSAAVKAFQAQQGLVADGVVGPKTTAALFAGAPPAPSGAASMLPWFEAARHLVGTAEVLGPKNNPASGLRRPGT